jgi:hypothetical protein
MHAARHTRGGIGVMVAECDQNLNRQELELLNALPDIEKLTYLPLEEGDVY